MDVRSAIVIKNSEKNEDVMILGLEREEDDRFSLHYLVLSFLLEEEDVKN